MSMGVLDGSGKGTEGKTYSLELCGGTHVARTGDIGAFVLLGDSASSAGVRRIEALTGAAALEHLRLQDARLADVASVLKAPVTEVVDRVKALLPQLPAAKIGRIPAARSCVRSGWKSRLQPAAESVQESLSTSGV